MIGVALVAGELVVDIGQANDRALGRLDLGDEPILRVDHHFSHARHGELLFVELELHQQASGGRLLAGQDQVDELATDVTAGMTKPITCIPRNVRAGAMSPMVGAAARSLHWVATCEEDAMAEPIVFISRNRVRQGKREAFESAYAQGVDMIGSAKPRTALFAAYLDESGPAGPWRRWFSWPGMMMDHDGDVNETGRMAEPIERQRALSDRPGGS